MWRCHSFDKLSREVYKFNATMHIVVHPRLDEINPDQWNALVDKRNPFLQHEFLHGLESCRCVCENTGWQPHHLALYDDSQTLLAAMPCYVKEHSYGEYIFDWSWVNAYHRHGIEYYPKLSNAIPFTPATGPRVLLSAELNADDSDISQQQALEALVGHAKQTCEQQGYSSFHSLFNTESQAEAMQELGLLKRHSTQFHWQNNDYQTFDDFLASMSSKKRKNIKRERRRVQENNIQYQWLQGADLTTDAAKTMYQFYARTITYYGAQSYLNQDFFIYLSEHFAEQTLFLFAQHDNQVIAGGLYFKSDDTLYGRYWGALDNFHSVHFETCYYQAIEWCIQHGYKRFEAGAQGEHKLARGLTPSTTYSSHWISHPEFRNAIGDFLKSEADHIQHYQNELQSHSPFKVCDADKPNQQSNEI